MRKDDKVLSQISTTTRRFWKNVRIEPAPTNELTPCWIWTGSALKQGYGLLSVGSLYNLAHRVSYQLFKGDLIRGNRHRTVDHLCRHPSCVNPDHLELVTHSENLARGNTWNAYNRAKTHCPHGHPYDEENTAWKQDRTGDFTHRVCRACKRLEARRQRAKKRLAEGLPLRDIDKRAFEHKL